MLSVGIDENGLGPRLGPLIVTAVAAQTSGEGEKRAESRPRGALTKRLGDSKALVAFADGSSLTLGEAWARAIAARLGISADTPDALVHAFAIDAKDELRRPCPAAHEAQCWRAAEERFVADAKLVATIAKDLDSLARNGIAIAAVRVGVVCTARINDAATRGISRFHVDLHTMERLLLDLRARFGVDVAATCGKVGGIDRYAPHFGPLGGWLHTATIEGRARSEYLFPTLGRVAFVRDADATNMLVAMASLVGKWVRDLLMARIVRYHRADDETLPLASGYHDPVTARFVSLSAALRKKRALPDDCFERRALSGRVNDDGGAATSSAPRSPAASGRPRSPTAKA